MAGTFTVQSNPAFLNARTGIYTAWPLRNFMDGDPAGPGVADYESFRVKQRGAGANLSADIGNTSLNQAWVRGTTRDGMGLYRADNVDYTAPTANTFLAQINTGTIFTTGDATNPRIDQVFLRILDQQHDGGGSNLLQVQVVDGTATGGATLDNRTGVGAVPANSILLADVLMPALASTVTTANIQDRRAFPLPGAIPPVLSAFDAVTFQPHPGLQLAAGTIVAQANFDAFQAAALMYLPRRIVGATRIKFKYIQGAAVAANTFYQLGIYDASGRVISNTLTGAATLVYAGAVNVTTAVSATITATTFEPGWYYVWIANAAATASSTALTWGAQFTLSGTGSPSVPPNVALYKTSGGVTAPNRLSAYTDLNSITAATVLPTVPVLTLSVG